ncbi:MAG TPA: transglutaminase domain-containing protein [Acidimicrobiales bacterium]|nr:transglutaminase domain-containing protein [Acidimicrobiales bacterium]
MTATTTPPVDAPEPDDVAPADVAPEATDALGAPTEGMPEEVEPERPANRIAVAVAFPTVAAAIMVGGIFKGVSPRFYAVAGGLLGVGLAFGISKIRNKPFLSNILIVLGLFGIGLLLLAPNLGDVTRIQQLVAAATQEGNVLRPPVEFSSGWQAIVGWLMGSVGFGATWVAIALKKPALALLLPLPIAAFAGISVPDNAQVASGIAVLVLFAISLGILSSEQSTSGTDDESATPPLSYELRKAAKAVPLLVAITVALFFLSKTNILFPDPVIDPAQEPQKPKTQPLSEVEDRVLFEVDSELTGPWRIGSLDVYDGVDFRLPPFAQGELEEVDESGVVDPELTGAVEATFTVAGLGGTVLPVLPNTTGVIAEGPKLSYDARNGNIRLVSGQVTPGLTYTVAAAGVPSVDDLIAVTEPVPKNVLQFTDVPDMPPAVRDLIASAPKTSKWEEFDFLRTWVLNEVTATGVGTPKSITPDRVQEILGGERKASPFEIVATQALLARWIGVPSRIGYGFDGGEVIDGLRQIRPDDGAAFVEVYFPGYKWLPVIGVPKQAEPTVGSDPDQQRVDPSILPSEDVAVQLYLPTVIPPGSVLTKLIALLFLIAIPLVLLLVTAYVLYPAIRKAILRNRRRARALAGGTRGRVALAYAEWRDWATDYGFSYPTDTPLMYLDRFIEDEEHTELAWLTTRVLWGDLQDSDDPLYATLAEELSRSLRRRLANAQPATVRAVAAVSRFSLRDPYAPALDPPSRSRSSRKERAREAVPA